MKAIATDGYVEEKSARNHAHGFLSHQWMVFSSGDFRQKVEHKTANELFV